jgi:hypothetical protein
MWACATICLTPPAARSAIALGLRSIMAALNMAEAPPRVAKKQLLFGVQSRFEVNPSVGGFLRSFCTTPSDLGRRIEKGTKLGEVVDIHSLEVIEELTASVTGYLVFSRCRRRGHQGFCSCRSNFELAVTSTLAAARESATLRLVRVYCDKLAARQKSLHDGNALKAAAKSAHRHLSRRAKICRVRVSRWAQLSWRRAILSGRGEMRGAELLPEPVGRRTGHWP